LLRLRRNGCRSRIRLAQDQVLERGEGEDFVPAKRAADGAAELAAVEPRDFAGKSNAFFESRRRLRKYSYAVPCTLLLPLLRTTLICAPELRPYSAEYVPVCTLNS